MSDTTQRAPTAAGRPRPRHIPVAGLLVLVAATVALGLLRTTSASFSTTAPIRIPADARPGPPTETGDEAARGRMPLGEADGAVPDGTTVFDDTIPGVARLDSALRAALRRAATDAAGDGVTLVVDSGWRSAAYQAQLLHEAAARYGSEAQARRWVATPETSAHVKGEAVDVGPSDAAAWLAQHGAAYGLCRVYANEPWHYELRPDAAAGGCPAVYADPTHDPRMQR